jgi:asparagine synthase (glutamine-hydrolysing)
MCGIAGRIGSSKFPVGAIEPVQRTLRHRGPDGERVLIEDFGTLELTMFFSRLAIVDLDVRSMQPVQFDESCLIFNGEIYNYPEIRTSLSLLGHRFQTDGDAEVLIHALREWGMDALCKLEGMWAFAWFDRRTKNVWLSRDRFGEKPLYWYRTPHEMLFASEVTTLKAISQAPLQINVTQIYRYLVNGYKALNKTSDTFYSGVSRLDPGSWMKIDSSMSIEIGRYWNLEFRPELEMTFDEAVKGTRTRLETALFRTLHADVPIAFCLSAGVDSNGLAFLAKRLGHTPVSAYTIQTHDRRYDESERVKQALEGSGFKHAFVEIKQESDLDGLRKQILGRAVPISTISYFLQSQLYKAMAKDGVKVALSGTAADEVFSGYFDHHLLYLASVQTDKDLLLASVDNWTRHIRPHVRNPFLSDAELFIHNPQFREHIYLEADTFSQNLLSRWSERFDERHFCSDFLRNRMMNELFFEATPVILNEDDSNAMAQSIENRSPYLDRQLVEFAYTIPTPLLIRDGYAKAILRAAVDDVVPKFITAEYHKVGFNATLTDVFDFENKDLCKEILADSEVFSLVSRDAVKSLLNQKVLPNSSSKFLFNVLNVKLFLENR